MFLLALALAACSCDCSPPYSPPAPPEVPTDAEVGDELTLTVSMTGWNEDWSAGEDHGLLVQAQLGANLPRALVIPGNVGEVEQTVSLGAWDGGDLTFDVLAGDETFLFDAMSVQVDPSAAGTPVLGTYDENWDNDTPLIVYEEDGLWTWVFTDEDGGTGLLPTLLMASWGRPVDIEGLWDESSSTIQSTDHGWIPFDGPYEGTHPLFQVVTYNGLIGPYADSPYLLSPMPVDFETAGGTIQRERVLDEEPWVLATSWAEAEREDLVVEDGGPDDHMLGTYDDYLFLDYEVEGGPVAFEAEVAGEWYSSLNGLPASGPTAATVSGIGRTCVELPPGAYGWDVDALRVRSYGDGGTATAARFYYFERSGLGRYDLGSSSGSFEAGGEAVLE